MVDIIINVNRKPEENEEQYIWRLGQAKDSGLLDMEWDKIADLINREFREEDVEYKEAAYRKPYSGAKRYYEAGVFNNLNEDKYFEQLRLEKRELEKERKKLQTEKLEYAKFLREDARDELIREKICNTISTISPLNIPNYIEPTHSNKSYLCCVADAHYGIDFEIKDLFGNILNAYSPEIFEKRMWKLFNKLIELIEKENIKELNLWELGDGLQGILRLNSQLMKLRYGIIDSSILYANYLANWINELSRYVRIKFQMVMDSNHNQLRICNAPKNAFSEENMSKTILILIKERLKDNKNVTIMENPTGMNYGQLSTYTILGIHGEVKNLGNSINEFSRALGTPLDYLIGAHCHHSNVKEVGINSECLTVRSLIGVDPYGMSLNKTSNAGASLYVFEQGYGKTCEYSLKVD